MARPRSARVDEVKSRLRTRLSEGVHRPGDRFLSAREVAAHFQVSYQTAHRLIQELTQEGWLQRRAASGTYIPRTESGWTSVQLVFGARARRKGSFGARLLHDLSRRLDRDKILLETTWASSRQEIFDESFPVLWEAPAAMEKCIRLKKSALLLNDRPRPGLQAAFFDSVSMDDFSGGVCAAELLLREAPPARPRLAVVAGPENDPRSQARTAGFLSLAPQAKIVQAGGWFYEDGYHVAGEAVELGKHGVFCCNDRLAEAIQVFCSENHRQAPPLVGFDDAPVAEKLNLTTIAIPWEDLVASAADIIKRRLSGETFAARQVIVTPQPVIRKL